MTKKLLYIFLLALSAVSCKMARDLQDTATELLSGEVVARVGKHVLHRSELENYIPSGVSADDSIGLARQYINAWAEDLLLLEVAEEQLSPTEKDVKKELEEYRRTLLKYRYEQLYIDQRLDTLITEEELVRYYNVNQDRFRLDRPLIKARYMIIGKDAKSLNTLKKKMSSDDETHIWEADSLGAYSAIKYADASDTWLDAITLAQELGTDYRSLLGSLKNRWAQVDDGTGVLRIAYVVDMVAEGKNAPLEYCTERIRDLILSSRKHRLEGELEKNLLEDARRNQKFVIY